GLGQDEQALVPQESLARREVLGGEPGFQSQRGLLNRPDRLLAQLAAGIAHLVGEDRPQPGGPLGVGCAPELVAVLMGLQERLLDQVRGVELAPQARTDLHAGQQVQVLAKLLQWPPRLPGWLGHFPNPPRSRRRNTEKRAPTSRVFLIAATPVDTD